MINKFLCWLRGHGWQPIVDPVEIRAELEKLRHRPHLNMAKCGRCGFKKYP